MHHLLEVVKQGQHGKDGLHNHAGIPSEPLADFRVFRVSILLFKAFIEKQGQSAEQCDDKIFCGQEIPPCFCFTAIRGFSNLIMKIGRKQVCRRG
jgi:hypothetical protein